MWQLKTSARVVAALALAGLLAACGSATTGSVLGGAVATHGTVGIARVHRASARSDAAVTTAASTAASTTSSTTTGCASLSKATIVADKKHGLVPSAKTCAAYVKHADLLNGVSCVGGRCVAVGEYYYGKSGYTLAELLAGGKWRVQPSASIAGEGALYGVSCTGSGHCLAVGGVVLDASGGRWRIASKDSDLLSVSCTGADSCVAVGTSANGRVPLFATWNGRDWHAGTMHAAPPQAQYLTVSGVSCASADHCVAVGNYQYGITAQPSPSNREQILAEQWNGRSWTLLPTVNIGHLNELNAVSCPSATDCTAIGSGTDSSPLAEQWNGKTWRVESVPTVNPVGTVQLAGVSCATAAFCVATGNYQGLPIAEAWNGKRWRVSQLPQPASDNNFAELNADSCASTSSCVAVGIYGAGDSFAEVYANGRWHLSATRNPT